ncbi:hypothetical protein BH11PLA2_BH11PLA2_06900 [soil metagenome]
MAPEQARGEAVDGRADLFGLGVVLNHLAKGRLPFPGDSVMVVLSALANDAPTLVRSVNPEVPPGARVRVFQSTDTDFTQRSDFLTLIGGAGQADTGFRGRAGKFAHAGILL